MTSQTDVFQRAASKLMVALDLPNAAEAGMLAARLPVEVILKIGLELIYADGLPLVRALAETGRSIFLDAKLSDIPNTVERATANAAKLGASFLTIHGTDRKTLDAAVRGRGDAPTKLLAITVLTSLDTADLAEQGIRDTSPADLVVHRAHLAKNAGFDGVVASAQEARAIREALGPDFLIVTPGIRPAGAAIGDQARAVTPAEAIAAGADYLVIGRPISAAPSPERAVADIVAEIASALS